ncbi:MAG: HEAT repeat domain-containing protein, partial [Rhodothermales bacterium]|nr:HEAT repeat domain-containing protein [Rhodothermales bacterium]
MRVLILACCLYAVGAVDASGQSVLRSLDVFGSEQVIAEDIRGNWGDQFAQLAEQRRLRNWSEYEVLRQDLVREAGQSGIYAFVDLAVVESWQPEYGIHVTLDLVDPIDSEERLSFAPRPIGSPEDPAGLIEKWRAYDIIGRDIRDATGMPTTTCRAFHCVWGYKHPDLGPFGDYFLLHVNANREGLETVLATDQDIENRRAAVYLFAHLRSQKQLLSILVDALADSHHRVREAALTIIGSIVEKRPDLVDVTTVIPHLNGPSTEERAAAISVLQKLAGPI